MTDEIKKSDAGEIKQRRVDIADFESVLSKLPGAVLGDSPIMPLTHMFADGIYCRQIEIPAGAICVGKIHRHKHPNILLKGRVHVFTEGAGYEDLEAPVFMISEPGTKRAVHAITDAIWITFHRTDSVDLEEIEKEVITPDYQSLDASDRKELR